MSTELRPITIAVDAMGGDHGPEVAVAAALDVLRSDSNLTIVLVGRTEVIEPLANGTHASFGERLKIHAATQVVTMDERPQDALRKKKDSSMRLALELVKAGEAD